MKTMQLYYKQNKYQSLTFIVYVFTDVQHYIMYLLFNYIIIVLLLNIYI